MKNKILSTLMVCGFTLTAISTPVSVLADEFDEKIEAQNQKIAALNERAQTAQAELDSVRATIAAIHEEASQLEAEQAELNNSIADLNRDIAALTERIEKRNQTIKSQARSVQVEGKKSGVMNIVFSSDSFSDAITRITAATKLMNANNKLMKQQEADKKEVEAKRAEAEAKMEELRAIAVELENKKGTLEAQETEQTVLINTIAAETATEESKKAEFIQQKEEAERRRQEQERLAREMAERQRQEQEAQAAAQAAAEAAAAQAFAAEIQETVEHVEYVAPAGGSHIQTKDNVVDVAPDYVAPVTETPQHNGSHHTVVTETPGYDYTEQAPVVETPVVTVPEDVYTPAPAPAPAPMPEPAPAPVVNGGGIIGSASKYLGVPYVWGGSTPAGFDCSGFTQYVFAENGISLPRVTTAQEYAGTMISLSELQPGDLVFFGARGATYHVGIYVGGGQYIHAPQPGDVVKYTSISDYTPSFGVRVN